MTVDATVRPTECSQRYGVPTILIDLIQVMRVTLSRISGTLCWIAGRHLAFFLATSEVGQGHVVDIISSSHYTRSRHACLHDFTYTDGTYR